MVTKKFTDRKLWHVNIDVTNVLMVIELINDLKLMQSDKDKTWYVLSLCRAIISTFIVVLFEIEN